MWLLAWSYWARRRLRRLLGRGAQGRRGAAAGGQPSADPRLPPDAPDAVVARNEHGLYCVPWSSQHRPVAQAILQSQVWEPDTLDLMRETDREGDIVHAGTYYGDFIPALARSRASGALVWGFEPGWENYRCSEITTKLNGLENVVLRHAGLAATSGTALLATGGPKGLALGGASVVIKDPMRVRYFENEEVAMVALDDVLVSDRRVAVIHLDVEGYEKEALLGAMRTIERFRPMIILESVPRASWVEEHLAPFGYRVQGRVDYNTVLRSG
jgi:FkbM family methyltransferase